MAQYRFIVNGDFVEFYDGSQKVTTMRSTSQDVDWFYTETPGIAFEIDGFKYNALPSQIEIDGNVLADNEDFDEAIIAIFPNLAGGADGGAGTTNLFFEISATFAAIAGGTTQRFIKVIADEENNGDTSLYLHDGTELKFLQTIA